MNNSLLLFATKCSVILYFATFTSINNLSVVRTVTPVITKGAWKAEISAGQVNQLDGYSFTFNASGHVKASKNGVEINGNWAEDNISKKISLNLGSADPALTQLNNYWEIKYFNNSMVSLQNTSASANIKLDIRVL